jgi:hypothetical protein
MLAGRDAIEKDAKSEGYEILGRKRRTASPRVDIIVLFSSSMFRIGALDPWVEHLLEVLLQHHRHHYRRSTTTPCMHQLHLMHYQIQSGSRSCASSVCSCVRSGLVRHHDTLCKCS